MTASIVLAEVRYGIAKLSYGERRRGLEVALNTVFADLLQVPGLPFDEAAVPLFATFMAKRRQMGRPAQPADGLIAGTAMAHGCAIATRDTDDFDGCGIPLINPWTD